MVPEPNFIPLARPLLGAAEIEAVTAPIATGWVTQGPEVAAFEVEFAKTMGADLACAVSNCTAALHLALKAVGVGPGDEVITVSHSFIATANSICYCGANPVFVDIEPGTFNIDPTTIAPLVTSRTKAILCVHQMGMPCDLAAILAIAKQHGLPVVEDAACAIGSQVRVNGQWEMIGQPHGDISCFSFHPRKVLTTGDGGMLTTNNHNWDQQFRRWRQHGMTIPDSVRHHSKQVIFESYTELGYNYRLTDIQAAIGRAQLQRLPGLIKTRRRLAADYRKMLHDIPGLTLPEEPAWARSNWQSYCLRLPQRSTQKTVMQKMLDDGIAARRGIMCAHREPAFAKHAANPGLTESEAAQDHTIIIPLFPQMTTGEQERVCASLRRACSA